MTVNRTTEYLLGLLRELKGLVKETEWVEFKRNYEDLQEIGEYISALSNSAALHGKAAGFVIWGLDDTTHEVIGTRFQPKRTKKGNEELENWLLRLLSPRVEFQFYEFSVETLLVVILEIPRASHKPVQFQGQEFIRVGSYKKRLKDFPEKERELWRIFDQTPFEELIAAEHISDEEVLKQIDYPAYFDLLELELSENRTGILDRLSKDSIIVPCEAGGWNITNLGTILFARYLDNFKHIKRKAVRVIIYKNKSRLETIREQSGSKGYANGFQGLIDFISNLLPSDEVIRQGLRRNVPIFPELAVRELVANAIIHQDFLPRGVGPMIEIFSDRVEITNPGIPLVKTDRFLDSPPKSRNEVLASFMRRIGVCEERGSGIDKVVFETEFNQLPAPLFEIVEDQTRAVLFGPRSYAEMYQTDRIRACYLHACLKCVNRSYLTNTSLRKRFGIEEKNRSMVSRIIHDTMDAGLIKPADPESASRRLARYLPYWA